MGKPDQDLGPAHAPETIGAVIGDLELVSLAVRAHPDEGRQAVAAKLTALAAELADLARHLQP